MKTARGNSAHSPAFSLLDRPWVCCALLTLLVVYYPVLRFGFVDYDDDSYVYRNAVVQDGLSFAGLASLNSTGIGIRYSAFFHAG